MSHPGEATHWYDREGTPRYTVIGANGRERPTTLADARKISLVPSVTTIIQQAYAPGLELWKQEQVLMAALTLPRNETETEAQWVARVKHDSKEQGRKAAERGTRIHADVQRAVEDGESWDETTDAVLAEMEHLTPLKDWDCEVSFASPQGYGGKTDAICFNYLIDFKTKEFATIDRPFGFDDHCMQLAAYRKGIGSAEQRCANLFISTTVPGLVTWRWWDESELDRAWAMFCGLLRYWKAKNRWESGWETD